MTVAHIDIEEVKGTYLEFQVWVCPSCFHVYASDEDLPNKANRGLKYEITGYRDECQYCKASGKGIIKKVKRVAKVIV